MSSAERPEHDELSARMRAFAAVVPIFDPAEPKPQRALTLGESLDLIDVRYREALDLLGRL